MADPHTGVTAPPPEENEDVRRVAVAAAATASLGIVAALMYALTSGAGLLGWAAFGGALLVAGAASFAGGVLGFLFAIPRSRQEQPTAAATTNTEGDGARTRLSDYAANTNLEQISDWLTKILVGIGLVEFERVQARFGQVSQILSPMLGTAATARAATITLMAYFGLWGFFVAYLLTRLWLPKALSRAETALNRAQREEKVRAQVAEQTADLQVLQHETYSNLYEAPPGGFTRAIQRIESYHETPNARPSAWLWLYLASAYGQQHAWIKGSEKAAAAAGDHDKAASLEREAASVQQKAVKAAQQAVSLDPSTLPIIEQLYSGKDPNENDLVTLKPALDDLVREPKGDSPQ